MAELDRRYRLLGRLAPLLKGLDPSRMTDEQIIALRLRGSPQFLAGRPVPGVRWHEVTIPAAAGPVTARVYSPQRPALRPRPVVLHLHGGGWMTGVADQTLHICTTVADGVDAIVVSVDYRLAPEHRFPAAVEDCYAALRWVHEHAAEIEGDGGRLAVMGESAGGNLAAATALMAKDRGGPVLALQTLTYPAVDMTLSSPSLAQESHHNLLPETQVRFCRDKYLPPGTDLTDWRASPLHAPDHRGLPPAHIITAEHDTLRDDGDRYATALRAAGVAVRYTCYVGLPHGFLDTTISPAVRRQALAEIVAEQRRLLGSVSRSR